MGAVLAVRWCTECSADQKFEVPPCEDGHGAECPDLACVECGAAVVVGLADLRVDAVVVVQPTAA